MTVPRQAEGKTTLPASSIVLFRRDLRIADNPALAGAMRNGPTLALYVLDDSADGRPLGGAGRWWLHHALARLSADLANLGVPLILRRGSQNAAVAAVAKAVGASSIFWNRRYKPWGVAYEYSLK
jgi:deoxyribodipyrimidine photo-lyase